MQKENLLNEAKASSWPNYGNAFKELCNKHNKTPEDIADLLNISLQDVTNIQEGKARLTEEQQVTLAKELKISPFELTNNSLDKSKFFQK